MPKVILDEKTGIAETAKARAKRMRDNEGASPEYAYEDELEEKGLDEQLANPELEAEDADEDAPSPDGRR